MGKELVLYFSVYGTTKAVAEEIAKQIKADLVEIEPAVAYDSNRKHYDSLARLAKREHDGDIRPAIKNSINIADYNSVFIGFPIWWYTFPMIIYTLFDEYDFSGKVIIPFNTHLGSRDGGTYRVICELQPRATVLKGLPVEMTDAEHDVSEVVEKWLKTLKIRQKEVVSCAKG